MTRQTIVQSVFDFAIREINALEGRIAIAEDSADDMLWEQARQVVEQLEAGITQRTLATQWINARTSQPYSQAHVSYTATTYVDKHAYQPRPRFRDAYNEIAHATSPPHVSQNSGNNEWYTPPEYILAARTVLGDIDLDPASSAAANAIVKAKQFYSLEQNGLEQPWRGRVWMNPPYSQPAIELFTEKFATHVSAKDITAGIVLVNNATDTEWFHTLCKVATAVCFPEGRVRFWSPDRDSAGPLQGQAVFYVGDRLKLFYEAFESFGEIWVAVKPG